MIFHVDTFYSKQVRILSVIKLHVQAILICYILEIINQFSDINSKCMRRKNTVQESTVV